MPVINVSDNFNRADGTINVTSGNWCTTSASRPTIISNQSTTPGTVTAIWKDRNPGKMSSKITLRGLSTLTNKGSVIVAAPDTVNAPPTTTAWTTGASYYQLRFRTGDYQLIKKDAGASTNVVILTDNSNSTIGDIVELTYDPDTGILNGFLNAVQIFNYTDPSPITGQQGIGFYQEIDTILDDWAGSWTTVSAPPPTGQTITDDFERAAGLLAVAGGYWVSANSTGPSINANKQLTSTVTGTSVHSTSFSGKHEASVTLISNASTSATARGGVLIGVENVSGTVAGTAFSWYSTGPWYRFVSRSTDYILQVKGDLVSTHTTVGTYTPAGGPAVNDVLKASYDPATGTVECFINGVSRILANTLSPLAGDHSRVGLFCDTSEIIDAFTATWTTTDTTGPGWKFYEFTNPSTELLLSPKEWNGAASVSLNIPATTEWDGGTTSVLPQVQPIHSDGLVESYGVNTGFNRDAFYGNNQTAMINLLIDLGVRHIRDRIFESDLSSMTHVPALVAAGIKACANMGNSTNAFAGSYSDAEITSIMTWINGHKNYVNSINGLNESNDIVDNAWAAKTTDWQRRIYNAFRTAGLHTYQHPNGGDLMYVSGPALKDQDSTCVHPVGPNLDTGAFAILGNTGISQYMDRGQIHRYPLGNEIPSSGGTVTYPENNYEKIAAASAMAGGSTLDFTEYGFASNPSDNNDAIWTLLDEDVAAVYQARMLIHNFLNPDIHKGYTFDLIDQGGDTAHGMVTPAFVKKQEFLTVKSILATFSDPSATKYVPPKFGLKMTYTENSSTIGTPGDGGLKYGVFARKNGTKMVVMWRLVRLWTGANTGSKTTVSAMNVTVETDGGSVTTAVKGFPVIVNINASNVITSVNNLTPVW